MNAKRIPSPLVVVFFPVAVIFMATSSLSPRSAGNFDTPKRESEQESGPTQENDLAKDDGSSQGAFTVPYEIELPEPFGATTVNLEVNLIKETFRAVSHKTHATQRTIGPLTVSEEHITLSNETGLSYQGTAALWGEAATVSLKKIHSQAKIVFTLTLKNPFTITIMPGKQLVLSELDLVIEKGKEAALQTQVTLFGETLYVRFGKREGSDYFFFTVPTLAVRSGVVLRNVTFMGMDFTKQNVNGRKVLFTGKADFSQKDMKDIKQDTRSLNVEGFISPKTGMRFVARFPHPVALPVIGEIKNAVLRYNSDPSKGTSPLTRKTFVLSGTASINFPEVEKPIPIKLAAHLTGSYFEIDAQATTDVTLRDITIKKPRVRFARDKVILSLTGSSTVLDMHLAARLTVTFKKQALSWRQGDYTLAFEGKLRSKKPYYPFKNVPNLEHIALRNAYVGIDFNTGALEHERARTLYIAGDAVILNIPVHAKAFVAQTAKGKRGVTLKAKIPSDWHFSQSIPELAKTVFDDLMLREGIFILSSFEYDDPSLNIRVRPGISLYGNIVAKGGEFEHLNRFLGVEDTSRSIILYGQVGKKPSDIALLASIPETLTFREGPIESGGLSLELSMADERPSIAVLTTLRLKPAPQARRLSFITRISIAPDKVVAAGTMQGQWKNPFGIKGLSISEVATQIDLGPEFAATGIPRAIGLTGNMAIGTKTATIAAKTSSDLSKTVLFGSISELTLNDILTPARVMNPHINDINLPDITLSNVKIKLAPTTTKIGEITIDEGLTIQGTLHTLGTTGSIDITVSSEGVVGQGSLAQIDTPLLKITSTDGTGNASVDLALTLLKQQCIINGRLSVLGIESVTDIALTKNGIRFDVEGRFLNQFKARVRARSEKTIQNPDLSLNIKLNNDFTQGFLEPKITEAIQAFQVQTKHDGDTIQTSVKSAITQAQEQAQADLNKAQANLDEVQAKVDGIKNNIATLQKKIEEEEKRFATLSPLEKAGQLVPHGAQLAEWRSKQGAHYTALGTATSALSLSKKFLKEVAAKVAEGTLQRAKEVSVNALEVSKQVMLGGGEAARYVLAGRILNIRTAEISGSLKELGTGRLPALRITGVAGNTPFDITMQIDTKVDVSNPEKWPEFIAAIPVGIAQNLIHLTKKRT